MKIVINKCYGGFGLSEDAICLYAEKKGWGVSIDNSYRSMPILTFIQGGSETTPGEESHPHQIERNDPTLIEVVEELGVEKASGDLAALHIVEIPDDVQWGIEEYDGQEWVAEKHRSWS